MTTLIQNGTLVTAEAEFTADILVEDGKIRLPFSSLSGVGEAAAISLREARDTGGEYISIDDLQSRAKVSSAVIDTLREVGALSGLPESSQTTLF